MSLSNLDLLAKIKSRGFWRIFFRPLQYDAQRIKNLPDCKKAIEENRVTYGWDYPHFPERQDVDSRLSTGNNYSEGQTDWNAYKEIWRIYQSGQFIHYLAMWEEWYETELEYMVILQRTFTHREILSVLHTTYLMAQIFEFLSRLTQKKLYEDGVEVLISLENIKDKNLIILGYTRAPLSGNYKADVEKIEFSEKYSKEEIIMNSKELALKAVIYFFNRFKWDNPPIEVIKNDQEEVLRGG